MLLGLLFLTINGCSNRRPQNTLPYFNTADFTPEWLVKTDAGYSKLHQVPPFCFEDQNGKLVTGQTTKGSICVVNFFFTRCSIICPKTMGNMNRVAQAFRNDQRVQILSHSVTPSYDNTAVLKRYALEKGISNPNWHLLTGDKATIYAIARTGYFADTEAKAKPTGAFDFLHTENFILVDQHKHIRGIYNGSIAFEADNLIRHIKILEQEE
ncbi:SCO family protein [Mucilaginibacter psychrotolerans]|uniref:SCO family protein n=2 Tax=Mucilaginibacter psychrotolerans TaxID=1524096 RepID=A0A4Y8SBK6_9SPHI|nr:SCO family protein [Mucilaginibacter psychrotolerans]